MEKGTLVNCSKAVNEYINREDWRISANANTGYSSAGLVNNLAGKMIANWWLDEVYSKEEGEAHRNGDYHIHDLDILGAYCFTKDTKIKTVEYGDISIAELLEKNIMCFTVVSFDGEKRVECNAHDLRCTRKDAELVEVEFEDGLVVRCTPDHKFLALTPETDPETYEAYLKVEWKPAAYLTMRTVRKAYTCPIIKSDIIKLEEVEDVITESDAKNSFAKVISVKQLNYKEDVYCMTVEDTHCFALENGVIAHNCCGHDLQKLLQEGFNGVISRVGAKPPKHFREALYQMANYLGILQAEWAGAQAFSSFDTLLAPYVFYDMYIHGVSETDIKKAIVNFIYNLNVPSRWGQSPFSNLTIDWTVPTSLKDLVPMRGDKPYFVGIYEHGLKEKVNNHKETCIGESKYLKFIDELRKRLNDYESDEEMLMYSITYGIFQPEMDIINRCFYQVLNEGDKDGQPFTFPIPTVNITEDFDWDNPNCYYLFENAAKYGSSYFQNFIGSQYLRDENGKLTIKDPNAYSPNDLRSMCPLTFETEVLVRSQWYAGYQQIGYIYNNSQKRNTKYECFYNGQWIPCNAIKVPSQTVYELTLSNNTSYKMGAYHLQPVYRDGKRIEISVKDIKPGDYIPFNSSIVDSGFTRSSYDLGYAVGAYLGDGCGKDTIIYSLDAREKDDETVNKLQKFWEGLGLSTSITIKGNLRSLKVNAERAYEIIKPFITGSNALNKGISNIINTQSVEMRQGLIDGYIATDGNRSRHRISTSSKQMVNDLIALFNSLGIKAYCFYTDTRDTRLGENPNYVVAYILNKDNYAKKYHTIDGEVYWEVTDIKEVPYKGQLYCLETESDHHLFTLKDGLITHNCRLQLDKRALRKRGGGLFGSDSQTGSIGVVTINMARLGYVYKGNMDGLKKRLKELCDMASSTLEKKRKVVEKYNEQGLYPYTRRYINTLDTFFSTIGVNGMNEMVRNFTNDEYDITDSRGQEMCKDLLDFINEQLLRYQEETGTLYNLEATPAEGTTRRLSASDLKRYPDIIQAGYPEAPYYTNSSQLPVDFSTDPFAVLDLQDELQKKYTGGTTLHLYMSERLSTPDAAKQLVKKVFENYRLPYISITPVFSICPKHGYIPGEHAFCPKCDKEIMAAHAEELDFNS